MLSDQPYRYLTVDEMKSLGDDSLPIDVTRDERIDSNRECMGKYVTYSFVMDFRNEVFHFLSLTVFCSQSLPSPALHNDISVVECSIHLPAKKWQVENFLHIITSVSFDKFLLCFRFGDKNPSIINYIAMFTVKIWKICKCFTLSFHITARKMDYWNVYTEICWHVLIYLKVDVSTGHITWKLSRGFALCQVCVTHNLQDICLNKE